MAFCADCGAVLNQQSGFCPSCGKAVAGSAPVPALQTASGSSAAAAASSAIGNNVAGALAYVLGFITGIIFLVVEPYRRDRFVRFHAMQSIFFSLAWVALHIAWSIVAGILFRISGFFVFIDVPLHMLVGLGLLVYWIFLMYQAYNGREYRIPFLGALAAGQAGQ